MSKWHLLHRRTDFLYSLPRWSVMWHRITHQLRNRILQSLCKYLLISSVSMERKMLTNWPLDYAEEDYALIKCMHSSRFDNFSGLWLQHLPCRLWMQWKYCHPVCLWILQSGGRDELYKVPSGKNVPLPLHLPHQLPHWHPYSELGGSDFMYRLSGRVLLPSQCVSHNN